jgi:hypothetical protein
MKPSPVTCIHVAAYLFSALVLGVSAVSYFHMARVAWMTDETLNEVVVFQGKFFVFRNYDFPRHCEFEVTFPDEPEASFWAGWFSRLPYKHRFLCFAHIVCGWFHGGDISIYTGPLVGLLIPPLTWMCAFHLLRLRGWWRTERSVQPLMPTESASSD